MKAKGRQKLKHYCPACKKQCRDDNGFKCHCLSEGHMRQMQLLGLDLQGSVEAASKAFMDAFLDLLKSRGRTLANSVYNDYIGDRHSIHMTATRWATLTEFVSYLGSTGKCKVDITEKCPFLTYKTSLVDDDAHSRALKIVERDIREEERRQREVCRQIRRAEAMAAAVNSGIESDVQSPNPVFTITDDGSPSSISYTKPTDGKISFTLSRASHKPCDLQINPFGETQSNTLANHGSWLCNGIVVKFLSQRTSASGCCLFRKKGVLRKVVAKQNALAGEILMLDSEEVVEANEEELQTVIPQVGGMVMVLNGPHRGCLARLLDKVAECKAKVQVAEGLYRGKVISAMDYEDISKLASYP